MIAKKRTTFGTKKKSELTDFEKSSIKEYKERFAKWHSKQLDMLTFCVNLIFTISIAIGGFIISNQDKPIFKDKVICEKYSLIKTALLLLAVAVTIGVFALISRLNDFRLTKNIIKGRRRVFELENDIKYDDFHKSDKENLKKQISSSICWTEFLGKTTWVLFYLQITFMLLIIWIIVTNV
jgi:uncharacterized membrane protein